MPTYLLDAGVLIRHLRGRRAVVRLLRSLGGGERLTISTVTRAEIRAGMRLTEDQATRRLLSRLKTIPVDDAVADRAGDLVRHARLQGRALHLVDALVAATAIQHRLTLVTLNRADFEGLGLSLYPELEGLA